jgi:hypothetical protein
MRLSGVLAIGCATPLILIAAARCGGDDPQPAAGTGGSTTGTGGSSAAGSGGVTGGAGGATAGGTGGATGGSGGTSGLGGATGGTGGNATGGTGGSTVVFDGGAFACEGVKPSSTTITDFAAVDTAGAFTSAGGYSGRVFTYGAGMTPTLKPALSMTGTVSNYTGFGFFLNQCIDASAYTGISFTISGSVGTEGKLMLQAKTNSTTPISATTKHGACVAADPNNTYADCWDPTAWVTVPATAATVTVLWGEFTGGKPAATVNPAEILGFQWSFNWAGATGVAYAANVTIDDVTFVQ